MENCLLHLLKIMEHVGKHVEETVIGSSTVSEAVHSVITTHMYVTIIRMH